MVTMKIMHRTKWTQAEFDYIASRVKVGATNDELVEHFKGAHDAKSVRNKGSKVRAAVGVDPLKVQALPNEVRVYIAEVQQNGGLLAAVYQRFPEQNQNTLKSIWFKIKRDGIDLNDDRGNMQIKQTKKGVAEWTIDHPIPTSFVFYLGVE